MDTDRNFESAKLFSIYKNLPSIRFAEIKHGFGNKIWNLPNHKLNFIGFVIQRFAFQVGSYYFFFE